MTSENSSPLHGSPPLVEISSEEDNTKCSESTSIHSIATLLLEPHSNLYSPTDPTMSPSTESNPNKCNSKHKLYSNPINMNPEVYTSNVKDITLHKYPVSTNTQGAQQITPETGNCVKKEHYPPAIVPNCNEYVTDNSFDLKTPKYEVVSPTTKSNLQQEISFYSAGTELDIKMEPVINSLNMYSAPFLDNNSTFQGNAKAINYKLLHVKTEIHNS